MYSTNLLTALGTAAVLTSCTTASLHQYSGTIERIEKVGSSGYVVSPRSISGYAAPWQMYVRLDASDDLEQPRHVWIDFADPDSRGTKVGDRVWFALRGNLPGGDRISAESIRDLQITPNPH